MSDHAGLMIAWHGAMSDLTMGATCLAMAAGLRDCHDIGNGPDARSAAGVGPPGPEEELIGRLRDAAALLFELEGRMQEAGVDMVDLSCGIDASVMTLRRAARAGAEGRWVAVATEFAQQWGEIWPPTTKVSNLPHPKPDAAWRGRNGQPRGRSLQSPQRARRPGRRGW